MGNEQSLTHRHVTDKHKKCIKTYYTQWVILGILVTRCLTILWVNKVKTTLQ